MTTSCTGLPHEPAFRTAPPAFTGQSSSVAGTLTAGLEPPHVVDRSVRDAIHGVIVDDPHVGREEKPRRSLVDLAGRAETVSVWLADLGR